MAQKKLNKKIMQMLNSNKKIKFVIKKLFFINLLNNNRIKLSQFLKILKNDAQLQNLNWSDEVIVQILKRELDLTIDEDSFVCGIILKDNLIPQYDRFFVGANVELDTSWQVSKSFTKDKLSEEKEFALFMILEEHFFYKRGVKTPQKDILDILREQKEAGLLPLSLNTLNKKQVQSLLKQTMSIVGSKVTRLDQIRGYLNLITKDKYLQNLLDNSFTKKS